MDAYETWMKGYYIKHGFFSSEAEMHAAFKAGREAGMREAAGPVYLVMAEYSYEGSRVVCAFALKEDADLFVERCKRHNSAKPVDTPENDAEHDAWFTAISKWEDEHPASSDSGADWFSVREVAILSAAGGK